MASELRVNSSTNRSGLGTITYTDSGPIVSGVGTFANGLTVDGTQTTVKSLKLTGDNYNANWFKTTNKLRFNDNAKATFGTADDLSIYHDGGNTRINNATGILNIQSDDFQITDASNTTTRFRVDADGPTYLRYNGSNKFETSNTGVTITGTAVAGALDISGDIDVDGQTNLDNVDVVGIMTVTTNTQYHGYKLSNGTNLVGELVGLSGSNDTGALALWSGGSKYVQLSAIGNSFLTGGSLGIGTDNPNGSSLGSNTGLVHLKDMGSGNTALKVQHGSVHAYFAADNNDLTIATRSNHFMQFQTNNLERLRIDSSGRVLIGGGSSPSQVGDGQLIVYSSDRLHPAIKPAGMSNNYANGYSMIGDNYSATESNVNLGISYSSASLVLSRCVKVSGSQDDVYLSSQAQYATRPSAIKLDHYGNFIFLTTETNATTAVDTAVTLTNRFQIDRSGNIYQKPSGRNMYFGSGNNLRIGVQSNGDSNIEAVSGDLKFMDAGSTIMQLRSDGLEMKQDIYFGTTGKGIVLGNTSNVDANTLDDYEEGDHTTTITMTGDTSFSYSSRTLAYTKIGRAVFITGRINMTGAGGSTFRFTLPFTCGDGNFKYETSNEVQNIRFNDGYTLRIRSNTSYVDLQSDGSATGIGVGDPHLNVNIFYFTA